MADTPALTPCAEHHEYDTCGATAAYFKATADGPFDHQRDAYEEGYEKGSADEREACARWLETRAKSGAATPAAAYELEKCARLLREETP